MDANMNFLYYIKDCTIPKPRLTLTKQVPTESHPSKPDNTTVAKLAPIQNLRSK